LDRLDQASLSNQQAVVRNERRENYDDAPYGLADEEVYHRLFPPGHPYHADIIGSHADIQAARLDDVRDFFRHYYVPNNASLVIVGDIDAPRTKQLVEKYFGTIPRGPDVPRRVVPAPPLTGEQRVSMTDAVQLPRVTMAWLTPPIFEPGNYDALVTRRLLDGTRASRLTRRLVHDLRIAQSVTADVESMSDASVFTITATAKPGHTLPELARAIDAELADLARHGPAGRGRGDAGAEDARRRSARAGGGRQRRRRQRQRRGRRRRPGPAPVGRAVARHRPHPGPGADDAPPVGAALHAGQRAGGVAGGVAPAPAGVGLAGVTTGERRRPARPARADRPRHRHPRRGDHPPRRPRPLPGTRGRRGDPVERHRQGRHVALGLGAHRPRPGRPRHPGRRRPPPDLPRRRGGPGPRRRHRRPPPERRQRRHRRLGGGRPGGLRRRPPLRPPGHRHGGRPAGGHH